MVGGRILLCLLVLPGLLAAQPDTAVAFPQEQVIEDLVAANGGEGGEFAFNAAFDLLEDYRRRPLDLNRATAAELAETLLLTPVQIDRLLAYRDRVDGLVSVLELQAVPGLDLATVRRLLPFVRIGNDPAQLGRSLGRMLAEGNRELYLRAGRRLERARGYAPDPAPGTNYYLGDPTRLYLKYRQRYGNRLSLGLVAEKDPGEPFFRATNRRRGFDFYSAHFYLRDVSRRLRAVALGDFTVSFGQGLILYTGFGFGKSSLTTSVARTANPLRPYTSVGEAAFLRGAGVTLGLGPRLELTVFGSRRGRGAGVGEDSLSVTGLDLSGLHRTPAEVEDRNAVVQTSYGATLQYRAGGRLRLGLNFLGEHLSRPLRQRPRAYNRFYFAGTDLRNASVDYRYRLRNFTFFGEVAATLGGGVAALHAVQAGLDRRLDVALVYRRYARDYRALSARPFAETNGGRNESGLYLGLELRPAARWRINAYYDLWTHPWLRFNVDAPSGGREYRLRLSYAERRRVDAYLEIRGETKGVGAAGELLGAPNLDPVVERTRFQGRLHFGYRITPALEWRSRLDAGFVRDPVDGRREGAMLYQDFHYRPFGAWRFSARFAVFDTDGFAVRFYQYEQGLTYNAFVVPYYHRGTRSFLVVRYRGIPGLTLEGRVAQTFYTDGTTFGGGLEATGRPVRTEIGGQVAWRF